EIWCRIHLQRLEELLHRGPLVRQESVTKLLDRDRLLRHLPQQAVRAVERFPRPPLVRSEDDPGHAHIRVLVDQRKHRPAAAALHVAARRSDTEDALERSSPSTQGEWAHLAAFTRSGESLVDGQGPDRYPTPPRPDSEAERSAALRAPLNRASRRPRACCPAAPSRRIAACP